MNRRSLVSLISLNVALLVALVVITLLGSPADAAQVDPTRAGDYIMLPMRPIGRQTYDAIIVVERRSGRMAALIYRSQTRDWEVYRGRDIARDFSALGR